MKLRRRDFLVRTTLASAVYARRVHAQSPAQVTVSAITLNRAQAFELFTQAQAVTPGATPGSVGALVEREASLRRQLWDILNAQPPESHGQYVIREELPWAAFLQEEKVPLVPRASEIQPLALKTPPQTACKDGIVAVVTDIVLSSLGLNDDVREVLRVVIDKSPELNALFDDLAHAVGLRDVAQTTDVVLRLLGYFKSRSFRERAIKLVGAEAWDRLKRQLALRVSAKFLPVVGQVYLGASIAIAVAVHFDRLTVAVKCRAGSAIGTI